MISPLLWQQIPFQDVDAFQDFMAMHEAWHRLLAGNTKTLMVLLDDLQEQGEIHMALHTTVAKALTVPAVSDLIGYDLTDEEEFLGWMQVHALDHDRLRQVTGI